MDFKNKPLTKFLKYIIIALEKQKETKMALNKAIDSGKEHRKPYRGSKAIDCSCRNHGGCEWCLDNRTIKYKKISLKTLDRLNEWQYNKDTKRKGE